MVADGKSVLDWVKYYVPIVNDEFGLSDRNENSIEFFQRILPYSDYIIDDEHYLWVISSMDMWGVPYLSVVSWFIKKEHRTVGYFKKVQDEIIMLAKKHKVEYIVQGSHLNDKLYKVLGKMGYRTSIMRRDL